MGVKAHELVYIVYGVQYHMRNSVSYPNLRHMLGFTNDQQTHHQCSPHDTRCSSALGNILAIVCIIMS